jgi:hypothetical protein
MNLTAADIDRIVAEVMRRLRAMTAGSSSSVAAASELKLSERVITLGTLKGRLDGVNNVIVTDRAIITPAVKDELKQRGITWARS